MTTTQKDLLGHLDDVRRGARELGDEDEGTVSQIAVLQQIVTSAQAAIANLSERGLAFLDSDLREYQAGQRRYEELRDSGGTEEIDALRVVSDSLYEAVNLALLLLGKPDLDHAA